MSFPGQASTKEWLLSQYQRDFLSIECGNYTYGKPRLLIAPTDSPRKLIIGEYCSIAFETLIFVGRQGRHPMDTLTTYPISMAIDPLVRKRADAAIDCLGQLSRTSTNDRNLDVEIGHDVWIGARSIILAGTKIGTGAVIGTGSIVTKDVAPYAVVAGSPARIIRFRFDESTIDRLLASRWWTLSPDELWNTCGSAIERPPISFALEMLERLRISGM